MNQDLILSNWISCTTCKMQPSLLSRAISLSLGHFWAFACVLLIVLRVTVHSEEKAFVSVVCTPWLRCVDQEEV